VNHLPRHLLDILDPPRREVYPPDEEGWTAVPRGAVGPMPVVELTYDHDPPPWWVTCPNDVPK